MFNDFTYNGATIRVRERVGRDDFTQPFLAQKFLSVLDNELDDSDNIAVMVVIQIIQQTVSVEGDLGLDVPKVGATAPDLLRFYEALMDDPRWYPLFVQWREALDALEPALDPELAPPTKENEKKG